MMQYVYVGYEITIINDIVYTTYHIFYNFFSNLHGRVFMF